MSSAFHTPIATGANANAAVFNDPWGTIDQAITDLLDASLEFEALLAVVGSGALDSSALLTLVSNAPVPANNKGFLPPRMTAVQKNAIASPSEGLILYDTTNNEPQVFDGSAWGGFSGSGVADMVKLGSGSFSGTLLTISGISQAYQDLCLRLRIRGTSGGGTATFGLRFNNLSAAGSYLWRQFRIAVSGAFPSITATVSNTDTEIEFIIPGSLAPVGRYAEIDIWIRNYTQATGRISGDFEGKGGGNTAIEDSWGNFEKTAAGAINRLDILSIGTTTGISGKYALYGLGRQGEIEMLDAFSVPSGPPLASPLVTDNTGTWVFVQTDGQFSIT